MTFVLAGALFNFLFVKYSIEALVSCLDWLLLCVLLRPFC